MADDTTYTAMDSDQKKRMTIDYNIFNNLQCPNLVGDNITSDVTAKSTITAVSKNAMKYMLTYPLSGYNTDYELGDVRQGGGCKSPKADAERRKFAKSEAQLTMQGDCAGGKKIDEKRMSLAKCKEWCDKSSECTAFQHTANRRNKNNSRCTLFRGGVNASKGNKGTTCQILRSHPSQSEKMRTNVQIFQSNKRLQGVACPFYIGSDQALGSNFFVPLGKCDTQESELRCRGQDRHVYIRNIPTGKIPLIGNVSFRGVTGCNINGMTESRGLVPGLLEDISDISPFNLMEAIGSKGNIGSDKCMVRTYPVGKNIYDPNMECKGNEKEGCYKKTWQLETRCTPSIHWMKSATDGNESRQFPGAVNPFGTDEAGKQQLEEIASNETFDTLLRYRSAPPTKDGRRLPSCSASIRRVLAIAGAAMIALLLWWWWSSKHSTGRNNTGRRSNIGRSNTGRSNIGRSSVRRRL